MANPTRSQLKAGAATIRDATLAGENTAVRVGTQHQDEIRAGLFEYDPNDTYQPNEYCIFQGALAKAKTGIGKNESPQSAPAKWDMRVAKTADDIVLGNYQPASSNAIAELLATPGNPAPAIPNATTTTRGKVRLATDAEYDAGASSDIVPSVKQVHTQLTELGKSVADVAAPPTPGLDAVTAAGNSSDRPYRHGPGQQRNPPLIQQIQRIAVTFFSGDSDIFIEANVTLDTLKENLRSYFDLDRILSVRNISRQLAVFGGLGLFKRVNAASARKIAVLTDDTIDGQPGHYLEWQTHNQLFDILLTEAPESTYNYIRGRLFQTGTPNALLSGTITGIRCINIPDGSSVSGADRRIKLLNVKDGDTVPHALDSTSFNQIVYDSTGRIASGPYMSPMSPPDPIRAIFNNPGVAAPFTGELHLTKRL